MSKTSEMIAWPCRSFTRACWCENQATKQTRNNNKTKNANGKENESNKKTHLKEHAIVEESHTSVHVINEDALIKTTVENLCKTGRVDRGGVARDRLACGWSQVPKTKHFFKNLEGKMNESTSCTCTTTHKTSNDMPVKAHGGLSRNM
jgi:hypothetical protein